MSPLAVILLIVVLSLVGPFLVKLNKSWLTWITLFLVNFVIIAVFVVVHNT
jgi:hypothetical protein